MGFSRQEYWSEVPLPSPEYILEAGNIIFPLSKKNVDMQNSSLSLNPRGTEMKFYITILHRHLSESGWGGHCVPKDGLL